MLLEYGALIIVIYACLFGPVIAGLLSMMKTRKPGLIIAAVLILVYVIFILIYTWHKANG